MNDPIRVLLVDDHEVGRRGVTALLAIEKDHEVAGGGLTNRRIGERPFIAERTVQHYISSLSAKPGRQRRTRAAALAARRREDGSGPARNHKAVQR